MPACYHFGVLTQPYAQCLDANCLRTIKKRLQLLQHHRLQQFPMAANHQARATSENRSRRQLVLDARTVEENRCAEQGQKCSLAALYASGNMPTGLLKAHNQLDKAVDAAYGYKPVLSRAEGGSKDDAARVAFLFERYRALSSRVGQGAR